MTDFFKKKYRACKVFSKPLWKTSRSLGSVRKAWHMFHFVFLTYCMLTGLPAQVFCEMRQDGGWTVFQRRSGTPVSFNREWAAYRMGFGDYSGK